MELSHIQEYYAQKTVLLTGATGYLGKLLLQKLLSTTQCQKIYVLVRPKNGSTPQERFRDTVSSPLFDNLKRSGVDIDGRVCVVQGDLKLPNLGLKDGKMLEVWSKEVECVFHTAAAARQGQSVLEAVLTNVRGLGDLLDLCKTMKQLKSFVVLSTAFSQCHHLQDEIDEKFYDQDLNFDPRKFAADLENNGPNLLERYSYLTKRWPDAFTFSMALAERLLQLEAGKLPLSLVRCSSIVATNHGPVRGFIDTCHGPTGYVIGLLLGLLRVFYGRLEAPCDIVTADYVANNLIAAAWSVNEYLDYDKCQAVYEKDKYPIYNCVSGPRNPLSWGDFTDMVLKWGLESPSTKLMWYPYKIWTTCLYGFVFMSFFLHSLPAMFVDLVMTCLGQKPVAGSFYGKMSSYFGTAQFYMNLQRLQFNDSNNQELLKAMTKKDRDLFNFDISDIDWESYLEYYVKGIRVYILKDEMSTIAAGRRKLQIFKYLHYALSSLAFVLFYLTARWLLRLVLSPIVSL